MQSLSVPWSSFLLVRPQTLTLARIPSPPPPRHFLLKPLHPPRRLSSSTASASASASASDSGIPIIDIVERDWSFLEANASTSDEERAAKARRIIAAAGVRPESRVLAALPTPSFMVRLVEDSPCELLVAIHESLLVLAMIKENHDRVRCWQGGVEAVPQKFAPFDAVFLCYLPGMGVSVDDVLSSLAGRCAPGARLVLSFDQGREIIESHHRQLHPDLVTFDLPDRIALEKAATKHLFQIIDYVDEPTFYLAVLRYRD